MTPFSRFDRNSLIRERQADIEHILLGPSCRVLLRSERRFVVNAEGPAFFGCEELEQMSAGLEHMVYLGRSHSMDYFAADLSEEDGLADRDDLEKRGLRELGLMVDDDQLGLLFYAQGMLNWHVRHGFCAGCGTETEVSQAGHARQCLNSECTRVFYPKLDPAVIFLIENASEKESVILLGRKAEWEQNRYSVIAGFVEAGETLEDAVRREAMEETGVEVSGIAYQESQPWPFPDSLMCAFNCRTCDTRISLNDRELETADWFSAPDLATGIASGNLSMPYRASVAWRLIDNWYRQQTGDGLDSIARFTSD